MTTETQTKTPREIKIEKAEAIKAAINLIAAYSARVWLADDGKVRVYVSTGVKDIGYIGFGKTGLICEVSTRGNHAMSVMPIARAAIGEEA